MSSWIFATWRGCHVLELRRQRVQLDRADRSDHPQTRIDCHVNILRRACALRVLADFDAVERARGKDHLGIAFGREVVLRCPSAWTSSSPGRADVPEWSRSVPARMIETSSPRCVCHGNVQPGAMRMKPQSAAAQAGPPAKWTRPIPGIGFSHEAGRSIRPSSSRALVDRDVEQLRDPGRERLEPAAADRGHEPRLDVGRRRDRGDDQPRRRGTRRARRRAPDRPRSPLDVARPRRRRACRARTAGAARGRRSSLSASDRIAQPLEAGREPRLHGADRDRDLARRSRVHDRPSKYASSSDRR